ncbi:MAG: pyridoxal phosphate-dependent aminotransferase [Candidatus Hydrogenedentes bacterium]|nr:pyridoxal phosphate-dependent aminotransferase [Candidatus Hydrogenedentota bacterium]
MFLSDKFSSYELSGELNILATTYNKLLEEGVNIIDLTISNPTQAKIEYLTEEIVHAITSPQIFEYRPNPKGLYSARAVIAKYYSEKGYKVSAEDIFLVSGTSEGYSYLLKLICNPGDKILVPAPSYPLLDFIAKLENVEIEDFSLKLNSKGEWRLDIESIYQRLDSRTKGIFFVQPNNPTGTILSKAEGENLIKLCEENGLCLIVDEVFREFVFNSEKPVPLLHSDSVPVFTLNGISKTLALPQLKLAWILAFLPNKVRTQICEALEIICDTYLSVNTPVQVGLESLFQMRGKINESIMERLTSNLEYALNRLGNTSTLSTLKPEGGWYLILRYSHNIGSEQFAVKLLKSMGVHVYPGSTFRFPEDNFLVISLLTVSADFKEGLEKIIEFTEHLERT